MTTLFGALVVATLVPIGLSPAGADATYSSPGTYSYTVPAGVSQVSFDVFGAQGGSSNTSGGAGRGGEARATLAVTPGEIFEISVGAAGGAGDYTGGSGGGASDVRTGTCASTLTCAFADRAIVAGGGGGGGGFGTFYMGPGNGGNGSGANGQGGGADVNCGITGGGGGTNSAGGGGGNGAGRVNGSSGTLGTGGAGGGSAAPGGGGGAGYYGGGGGGGDSGAAGEGFLCDGGGGGGGSGFITSSAIVTFSGTGVQSGSGKVLITTLSGTATTTTVTSSVNPSTASQQVTYTATVSPAPDGGTVQFSDNGSNVTGCGAQPVNTTTGVATCTITYKTISSHPITAAYVGDTNFLASNATLTQVVNAASATTTTLTSSANPSTAGQQVTYTATVTPAPDAGTVAFADNGSTIAACATQSVNTTTGVATCSVTYTTAASRPITATYGGDTNYPTSTSSTLTQVVNAGPTTTTLTSSLNPSALGQQVIYTATVSPAPDGGTVAFADNGSTIAACATQSVNTTTGKATCAVTYTSAASHPITAVYGGDTNYATSSSATLNQTINTSAPSYPTPGTYSYTVPAGVSQVSFDVFGAQGGSSNTSGGAGRGGEARATLAVTPGEIFEISVGAAGGAGDYTGGSGGGASDVRTGTCASTLTCAFADRAIVAGGGGGGGGFGTFYMGPGNGGNGSGANGQGGGADVNCGITGGGGGTNSAGGGGGNGAGRVNGSSGTLGTGGAGGGSAAPGGGGGAGYYGGGGGGGDSGAAGEGFLCDGGGGGGGSGFITSSAIVTFSGTGVQSGSGKVLITTLSGTATTTTVTSSVNPSTASQQVTYTATVSPAPDGGTVQFSDNGSNVTGCGAQPVNTTTGVATCTITYKTISSHPITAAYVGDTNFLASNATLTQVVNAASATTTTLTSSANPSTAGQQVTYTATVTPAPDAGTVAFADNGSTIAACATQSVNTTTGVATCSVTYTTAASHPITATYGGDTNYPTSTSSTLTQVVNAGPTTTTLTSSLNPSALGQQVIYTATVSPAPDGGTVAFADNGSTIAACATQSVNTTTGKATCAVTYTSAASHPITAVYGGDTNYLTSMGSLTPDQSVGTAITVTVSGTEVYASASPTFSQTNNAPGGVSLTGTLTCGSAGGTTIPATTVGHHTIDGSSCSGLASTNVNYYVVYVGATTGLSVTKDSTTTAVSASPSTVTYGNESAAVFTVTVSTTNNEPVPSSTETATVSVGSTSCVATLAATAHGAQGTCPIANTALAVGGPVTVSASYSGDADLTGSSGNATTGLSVTKDSTTTAVSASPSTVTYGNESAAVFTVTVSTTNNEPVPSSTETATVSVGSTSCVATLAAAAHGAQGTCPIANTALAVGGPVTVSASYSGDADLTGSSGNATTGLSVTKDSTTTAVSASPSTVTYGNESAAVFTVTVSTTNNEPVPSSTETATVSVGSTSCVATLAAAAHGAQGTCPIANTALAVGGPVTVSASYSGDADLTGSSGNATTGLSVTKDSTTTAVSASPSTVTYGNESAAVFTVTVSTTNNEPVPSSTETATVSVGSTSCVATLAAAAHGAQGTCPIANTALAGGNYTASATYGGDSDLSKSPNAGSTAFTVDLKLGPASLPNGTTGAAYPAIAITASGATGPIHFAVTSGVLPTGLTLNPSTGVLSGVPTGSGMSTFMVTATLSNGGAGTGVFSLDICGGRFRTC